VLGRGAVRVACGRVDLEVLCEVRRHEVRGRLRENDGRPLQRRRDEARADELPVDPEHELAAGEEREGDAHDRGQVIVRLPFFPVLRKRHRLHAVRAVRHHGPQLHEVVLRRTIVRDRRPDNSLPHGLDQIAVGRHDQRRVIPPGVFPVRTMIAELLTKDDKLPLETVRVRQDEISRHELKRLRLRERALPAPRRVLRPDARAEPRHMHLLLRRHLCRREGLAG